MKPRAILILTAITAFFCALVWWFFFDGRERWSAHRIVGNIEEYRRVHGHLPDPGDTALFQSLGFELRVGYHPDYLPVGTTGYVITLLKGFDGPHWIYESKSASWREGYPLKHPGALAGRAAEL